LDTPTSGRYILNGKDVSRMSDDQLAEIRNSEIGFIFQVFNLLPRSTALENVMLPLVYSGIKKAEVVITPFWKGVFPSKAENIKIEKVLE